MKEGLITTIIVTVFLSLLYSEFKAYIKVNLGKTKEQNKEINNYILRSVVYQSITTVLSTICIFKFL